MVYTCVQKERNCENCKYEPVCYDSEYIKRLYDAVPPQKLQKTGSLPVEDVDS